MSDAHIQLLQEMAVFGGLSEASILLLLEHSEAVYFSAGAFFFREGDPGGSLFVIEEGKVVVERQWEDEEVVLGRMGPGDCVGEMSLIDFQARSASVKAETDCNALMIPTLALNALYKENLGQYAMIMMNLGREVSRRLRAADDKLFAAKQRGMLPS